MIGERIKVARENLNISQRELGRRIEKTGQYISYLESNEKSNPSIEVLSKIADSLNVSLLDLLGTEDVISINKNDANISLMLNTSDVHLAIFMMLNNFKCFENLNISNRLSKQDFIFLSQIIANNINSTIDSFNLKRKKELLEKFNNISISNNDSYSNQDAKIIIPIENEESATLASEPNVKSFSKMIKNIRNRILYYTNSKTSNNEDLNTIKEDTAELLKLINETKDLEKENKKLEIEVKNLEKEIKELIYKDIK